MRNKKLRMQKRKVGIRAKIVGSSERPRLNVFRSNYHIYGALIDDSAGKTLVSTSDKGMKLNEKDTKTSAAFAVGKMLAEKALKKNFKTVVFDRGGYLYHGRVKALAEGAREGGLEF
jgi:large subunit ribosomal protein L18